MAKMNKLLSLLAVPLLLTACDTGKVYKPSFAKFGNEVDEETYDKQFNGLSKAVYDTFYVGDGLIRKELIDQTDYQIIAKYTIEHTISFKKTGIKDYGFSSVNTLAKIDNGPQRAKGSYKKQNIYKSNRSKNDPGYKKDVNETISNSVYAEMKYDAFYYTNDNRKEYRHIEVDNPTKFATLASEACLDATSYVGYHAMFDKSLMYIYVGLTLPEVFEKYYVNNNVFTEDLSFKNESINVKYTKQYKFESNCCSHKGYVEQTTYSDETTEKYKIGWSVEIQKTELSVSEFNYSSCQDTTDNYY